jgi:hypothetical protein
METERACGGSESGRGTIAGQRSCALVVATDQPFIQERVDQLSDLALELLLRDLELGKKPLDDLRLGGSFAEQVPQACAGAVQLEDPVGTQVDEHSLVVETTRDDVRLRPERIPLSVLGCPRRGHGATIVARTGPDQVVLAGSVLRQTAAASREFERAPREPDTGRDADGCERQ